VVIGKEVTERISGGDERLSCQTEIIRQDWVIVERIKVGCSKRTLQLLAVAGRLVIQVLRRTAVVDTDTVGPWRRLRLVTILDGLSNHRFGFEFADVLLSLLSVPPLRKYIKHSLPLRRVLARLRDCQWHRLYLTLPDWHRVEWTIDVKGK
jgi:hypothetical protein